MKPITNCPFCQWLRKLKSDDEYYHTLSVYKPALVDIGYYKQIDDEHICGKTTYQFDELNFCPVCGKNLKEA